MTDDHRPADGDDDTTIVPQRRDETPRSEGPREADVTNPLGGDAPSLPITPPVEIPNHELVRCIGVGGFGQVWLGRHTLTEHYRACKLIPADRARELHGLKRIKRDVVTHPGLVPVEDVGVAGDWLYCLMPLADSARSGHAVMDPSLYVPATLKLHLQRSGRLRNDEAIAVGLQIAEAIAHLHRHGVTHGDVKPANVLRLHGRWALADHGLADDLERSAGGGGTPGYVPPEGPGSAKADQYAFGILLMELLTGRPPAALDAPGDARPGGVTTEHDGASIVAIARRAAARHAEDRFTTLEELCAALRRTAEASAVAAPSRESDRGVMGEASLRDEWTRIFRVAQDAVIDFWVAIRHGGVPPEHWSVDAGPEAAPSGSVRDAAPTELSCANCSYDLHGLSPDGLCPECGLAVADSMRAAGVWNVARLRQVRAVAILFAAMIPAWFLFGAVPQFADPTVPARVLVVGAFVGYAAMLLGAAFLGVHANSTLARRRRRAIVVVLGGISTVPAIIVALTVGLLISMGDAAAALLILTMLVARTALLGVTAKGMGATSRAFGLRGSIVWTVLPWIIVFLALVWAVGLLHPEVHNNLGRLLSFIWSIVLLEGAVHVAIALLSMPLYFEAGRRIRSMRQREA